MHMINPLYSIAGVFVGILVGFTGVGGGSLMTPLLILLFGFHPATAVGTDLLYAAITKTAGTAVHGISGTVDWKIVRRLATGSVPTTALTLVAGIGHWWSGTVDWNMLTSLLCGSIPGIVLGSWMSARVPEGVLRPILACVLIIVGGRLVF